MIDLQMRLEELAQEYNELLAKIQSVQNQLNDLYCAQYKLEGRITEISELINSDEANKVS